VCTMASAEKVFVYVKVSRRKLRETIYGPTPRAPSCPTAERNLRMIYYYYFFLLKPKSWSYKSQKLRSKVENKGERYSGVSYPSEVWRISQYYCIQTARRFLHHYHGVYKRQARYFFFIVVV